MTASPLSTGGAGPAFETEVAAIYLVAMLCGAPARGGALGTIVNVALQRRASDVPLDDIAVVIETVSGRTRLDLQVKRSFGFTPGDTDFAAVLKACWDTSQRPEFRSAAASRLGVAIGNFPQKVKAEYARVPLWAQNSSNASEFLNRINGLGQSSAAMRQFVKNVHAGLAESVGDDLTKDSLWDLFRHLVIVDFDVHLESSRDRVHGLEALQRIVPNGDPAQAGALYNKLQLVAREVATTGGDLTQASLIERLQTEFSLLPSPSYTADLERLADHSKLVLDSIETTIGSLTLDRTDVAEELLERVSEGGLVFVAGAPGTGKSALLRTAAELRRTDGPVIALSAQRIAGGAGWHSFAATLGIEHTLDELVGALSGTTRPCLVIDGLDRIEEGGAQLVVNDILRALLPRALGQHGVDRWSVVASLRDEACDQVLQWLYTGSMPHAEVRVPELTDDDVVAVAEAFPHLQWALLSPSVSPVLRNLYFLRVLAQAHTNERERPADEISEVDIARIWWERIVGRAGNRARQQVMLHFGKLALESRARRLLANDQDPGVVRSLEIDGVVRRDASSDSYWFGHDILEEWSACRVLAQHENDLAEFLHSIRSPYWATRALQLLACDRLEIPTGVEAWKALLAQVRGMSEAKEPWVDAVITAPLRSVRLSKLLPLIEPTVWAEDGALLGRFLRALRTQYIVPNAMLAAAFEPGGPAAELSQAQRATLLLDLGLPSLRLWGPVLRWLAPRLTGLPARTRGEASRVMQSWQRVPGLSYRRQVAEAAIAWYSELVRAPNDPPTVILPAAEPYFDRLRDIVVQSADVIPERIAAFLAVLQQTGQRHDLARWIAGSPQRSLAEHTPAQYVNFCLDVLAPNWRVPEASEGRGSAPRRSAFREYSDPDWQELRAYGDTAFLSPSHVQGPFLLLLRASEQEGLRLIITLVNIATHAWQREVMAHQQQHDLALVLRFGEQTKKYLGDASVYQWFRPNGNGPYLIVSALMALEVWMEEQVESGRDVQQLFATVLESSESVSIVGLCVAIALAYPERSLLAAEPLVSSPLVWQFDISRYVTDSSGTFSIFGMLGRQEFAEKMAVQRDKRPQRRQEIRHLVPLYLFGNDIDLRDRVAATIRAFPNDSSPLTEDERNDPRILRSYRQEMENFVAWGDAKNYRRVRLQDGEIGIAFYPPSELQARNRPALERYERTSHIASLEMWASAATESGQADGRFTSADAILAAKGLQETSDYSKPVGIDADIDEGLRLEAIVGVAAAVLTIDAAWVVREKHESWCKQVLVSAARLPRSDAYSLSSLAEKDVLSYAGHGLMLLLKNGLGDAEIRLAAFRLLRHPESQVVETVFAHIRGGWDFDPVFCCNAIQRECALAAFPVQVYARDPTLQAEAEEAHSTQLAELEETFEDSVLHGRIPVTISIPTTVQLRREQEDLYWPEASLNTWRVERAFRGIPLSVLVDPKERDWIVRLTEHVLQWTIAQYPADKKERRNSHRTFDYGWPNALGNWIAGLIGVLPDEYLESNVFGPLHQSWPATAELVASILHGITKRHLGLPNVSSSAAQHWRSLAQWIVPAEPIHGGRHTFMERSEEEAVALLVHVRHGQYLLSQPWKHAANFLDVYERWTAQIAHNHWGFRTLLAFLIGAYATIDARTVVRWLSVAVRRAEDRGRLWAEHDVGANTAELLSSVLNTTRAAITADSQLTRDLVWILDELSAAGVPLAARMRSSL